MFPFDRTEHSFTYQKPVELLNGDSVIKICAPMVRFSKLGFRTLVRRYDCDLAFTPMIIADSYVQSQKARDNELTTNEYDRPLVVQFAANNAVTLAAAAEMVSSCSDGIDLNCGCPQRWAMQEGYGAKLLTDPQLLKDMVLQTRNRISDEEFSISVKIRILGDLRRTVDLCQQVEQAGLSWISVHGRTKDQRNEPVNLEAIRVIKESLRIPVVANGDVKSLQHLDKTAELTGADGVMVARGILENPALFAGYDRTPAKCVADWLEISGEQDIHFTAFHRHLMQMCEKILCKSQRRTFNAFTNKQEVISYLSEHLSLCDL